MQKPKAPPLLTALLLPSIVLIVAAGCNHTRPQSNVATSATDPAYVGNEACKPCHATEYNSHHLSFHDTSLRIANRIQLGSLMPQTGIIPLAGYAFETAGDSLEVSRTSPETSTKQNQKLDLVFGSGKLGMTYASFINNNDSMMETRMSYFPPYKVWELTPGQEVHTVTDTPFGRIHPNSESRMCLGCHVTTLSIDGIRPQQAFLGVGCEACHGPGKPHIDAVKSIEPSGRTSDLKMENLGARTPTHLNELCGKCHRTANNVDLDTPEVNLTHRFQPYAMLRSSCRTRNNEPLSCLFCHDSHTNVSTRLSSYEAVCLACHGGPTVPPSDVQQDLRSQMRKSKVCPVNPKNGCIGCHMRPKVVFPLTSVPAKMADHLISPPGSDKTRTNPRLDPSRNTF